MGCIFLNIACYVGQNRVNLQMGIIMINKLYIKTFLFVFFTITLCACMLSACAGGSLNPQTGYLPVRNVKIGLIKGPSSIGMIKFMDEVDNGEITTNNYSFEISAAADEIVPKIVQGKIDIAAVPANLSSVLYNNTQGKIQVIAISTLGMMYVVENGNTITSIEDLRGKTIYAGFKGNSPEYDFNYILGAHGINPGKDLDIEWKSEHTECVAALATGNAAIAILPQPFVTIAQMQNENIRIAIDLNNEWEKLQEESENPSALVTGVIVARTEFINQNPGAIADFLERYSASVEYANANIGEAADLVGKYDIFPVAVAQKAIPYCNITFIEGQEMKEKLSGYLSVLFEQNPQAVGGALPGDGMYHMR